MTAVLLFLRSAGVLLLATAAAKVLSAVATSRALQSLDPIFMLPFRYELVLVAGIEAVLGIICFLSAKIVLRAALLAWLTSLFLIYRLGLLLVGYEGPCRCLGNLTDALHVAPQTADAIMKGVLGYLLVGSLAVLSWCWLARRPCSAGDSRTAESMLRERPSAKSG
jgi:hypothetical protein